MIKQLFFNYVDLLEENIYCVIGEVDFIVEVICYSVEISDNMEVLEGYFVFDLVIFGMGFDGYIVFIFLY